VSTKSLWLVTGEGWWAIGGTAPKGAYGVDWCVMCAFSGRDAFNGAPEEVTDRHPWVGLDVEMAPKLAALHAFDNSEAEVKRKP
jgi:hypothetical protein